MKECVKVLISEKDLNDRIREIAKQIDRDYQGKDICIICILKGSIFFTCELAKNINSPVSFDFIKISSYGDKTVSSGNVKILMDLEESVDGKDIIIVEDIIDSGRTLSKLVGILSERNPASLRICTLLNKKVQREYCIDIDYCGFEIEDRFVVGFGLDYAQKYRNLPYIGVLEFKN